MNYRNIPMPNELSKKEIIDILLKEEYGYLPEKPIKITAEEESKDEVFCAGSAVLRKIILKCELSNGEFSFPIYYTQRVSNKLSPCFLHINFRDNVPDKYQPTEEIIDRGYSVVSFCYKDITSDDADFTNGLAGVVYQDGKRDKHQCGKIGLWAWAAMCVMDYLMTLPEIDKDYISVAGHSRLGKTALLTGALDERFFCAFSNDSGCSGASVSRGKQGESIKSICKTFPFWFAENYKKYSDKEEELPFDQHYLVAANAPHRVYVASAEEDLWADPQNEYLSCRLASEYYEKHGLFTDLNKAKAESGDQFHNGYIGYHIRKGKHYFSRQDWLKYMDYIDKCTTK